MSTEHTLLMLSIVCFVLLSFACHRDVIEQSSSSLPSGDRYLQASMRFAETVLAHGGDTYGDTHSPLFVDGMHSRTLEPVIWCKDGEKWVLSNLASQQPLLRLLDGLTGLTGEAKYRAKAEAAVGYAFDQLRTPNGLLHWGGHTAWDLAADKPVGEYTPYVHELKGTSPYFELMWRMNSEASQELAESILAGHILSWSFLDYNRHASTDNDLKAQWDASFNNDISVPFPAQKWNLSFVNVTPTLMYCGVALAVHADNDDALTWARRLVYRWQEGRDAKTGLCGGQISYWPKKDDRAQKAFGHVHPDICEAKMVATYHQKARYHYLPLTQMQAGEELVKAGGRAGQVGKEFIDWACDDLQTYARYCWDDKERVFHPVLTDGTRLKWQECRPGYYGDHKSSLRPLPADGLLLWSYSMAYRLTGDQAQWKMIGELCRSLGLGEAGACDGSGRELDFNTGCDDWGVIYGLLELSDATDDPEWLRLACRVGDNILKTQTETGLFPRRGREFARTGDEIPLSLLHLAAACQGRRSAVPAPTHDSRGFHCEYHGPLPDDAKKPGDKRTTDGHVFY